MALVERIWKVEPERDLDSFGRDPERDDVRGSCICAKAARGWTSSPITTAGCAVPATGILGQRTAAVLAVPETVMFDFSL